MLAYWNVRVVSQTILPPLRRNLWRFGSSLWCGCLPVTSLVGPTERWYGKVGSDENEILLMVKKSGKNQLRLVDYPTIYKVWDTSQVVSRISSINSIESIETYFYEGHLLKTMISTLTADLAICPHHFRWIRFCTNLGVNEKNRQKRHFSRVFRSKVGCGNQTSKSRLPGYPPLKLTASSPLTIGQNCPCRRRLHLNQPLIFLRGETCCEFQGVKATTTSFW